MLVSVVYQHEPAMRIHMSPPFWNSLCLPFHPTPPACHRAPGLSSLNQTANSHWLSVYLQQCICFSAILSFWIEWTLGLWKWHTNTDLNKMKKKLLCTFVEKLHKRTASAVFLLWSSNGWDWIKWVRATVAQDFGRSKVRQDMVSLVENQK